jgi:GntR family transcriptional regulator / MocR family aminotransferase
MFLHLDGGGPVYAQLIRALKRAILEGRLSAGTRLPSTRILAEELNLSRTTVTAAYEQLQVEGFLNSHRGSGNYINPVAIAPTVLISDTTISPQSRYTARARRSYDRTISELHNNGTRYNLQYGNPLINPSLSTMWGRELARASAYTPLLAVDTQGLEALREQICDYLARRRGIVTTPDNIIVVNGAQQAYTLAARVLVNEDETIVMEEPHYHGAYQALIAHGAKVQPVPVDGDGLIVDELPPSQPRLICVTPSCQFPTGSVLSPQRRMDLLHYASKNNCWILEDDCDNEFYYEGRPPAALRSLDQHDQVIYVGTFSKILFESLRIGYIVVPSSLRKDFVIAKYFNDFSSTGIEQAALANFMRDGGLERHLRLARIRLRSRRESLLHALRKYAGQHVDILHSVAGMHIVTWLKHFSHDRAKLLLDLANERGLGLHPIALHFKVPPNRPGFILGYSSLSSAALHQAMKLFGECLNEAQMRRVSNVIEEQRVHCL